jgi:hypothetical protein
MKGTTNRDLTILHRGHGGTWAAPTKLIPKYRNGLERKEACGKRWRGGESVSDVFEWCVQTRALTARWRKPQRRHGMGEWKELVDISGR